MLKKNDHNCVDLEDRKILLNSAQVTLGTHTQLTWNCSLHVQQSIASLIPVLSKIMYITAICLDGAFKINKTATAV